MTTLPSFYFRIRENGAAVFRVDSDNRHRRIEMEQIAIVNINRSDFKAHGDQILTADDETAINNWIKDRKATLARRDLDDIHRAIDHLNLTAHWVQSKACDSDLDAVTDRLLLAMHDLRNVLVRKKSERQNDQKAD